MEYMGLNEIREEFLSFFEQKAHLRAKSASLVPQNDNSLLLINSGMAPLKAYFTGIETPPSKRMTTCQKCIRTGDIENVGKTTRHGTFFEMLGNFSFGDYFKNEIIPWSWEFCTEVMKIPVDRLFVSVFQDDDEAYDIWNKKIGLPKEKVFRMGRDDNFWEVGTGPCGPCSEIYFDRGEKYGCDRPTCTVGCECDRYIEFWNLVFTQFYKNDDGTYDNLEFPNIDTGMGLERIALMMQDSDSIFDVDTLKSIRDEVCSISGVEYGKDPKNDVSIRVITDHVRSVTFMTADGILPNNEGRGYVLRRLLRRAARCGKLLGIKDKFLSRLSKIVIKVSKDAYPELLEKESYIFKIIDVEESRFYETLDQGIELLKNIMEKLKNKSENMLSGAEAFKLYDTYGFPIDLTKEILDEQNIKLDYEAFKKEMNKQRETSRTSRETTNYMGSEDTVYNKLVGNENTVFTGYDTFESNDTKVVGIIANDAITDKASEGMDICIILDKTPFYAEGGGQKADIGIIENDNCSIVINNCIKVTGNRYVHTGTVKKGELKVSDIVSAIVDKENRLSTSRNHSATHLLQKVLRQVLGTHVEQAGSYVSSKRLRFDFTHFEAISNDDLQKIEWLVNEKILETLDVSEIKTDIDTARKMGAMALFGEKYGDDVRVIDISGFSLELCGGTHIKNTAGIGTFKIVSESGIAAGVRRIEALTGFEALNYYHEQDKTLKNISTLVKSTPDNAEKKIETFIAQIRELKSEIDKVKSQMSGNIVDELFSNAVVIKDTTVLASKVDNLDMNGLRLMTDKIKDKLTSGVIVLISSVDDKVNMIVTASSDVVDKGIHAGEIIKEIAAITGGKGGGKPNMAQAGGKDITKIDQAPKTSIEIVYKQLNV